MNRRFTLIAAIALSLFFVWNASAQGRGGAAAPSTARQMAPFDPTGYWVSYITEDWRYRMMTPPKGDYARVNLNAAGRKVADSWNPDADIAAGNQCKAFGAGAIMRVPSRFHITWQDDNTLRVESDAGTQARVFHFKPGEPPAEKTWQGYSTASWDRGALKVVTTNVKAGYLRFNGVPYSENATITEYFDLSPYPAGGGEMLFDTVNVTDPTYLTRPYIVSSHYNKEKDGSKWSPTPCTAKW